MKCMANTKTFNKARKKSNDRNVRLVVRYLTAATAEIMLEKFHWSQERLLEFLTMVWHNFNMTNTPLAEVESFDPADNFGYKVKIKNGLVRSNVSPFVQALDSYAEKGAEWFIDVLVYTLKDHFNWADSTTDRFVRYIDGYLPKLRTGSVDVDVIIEKLKIEHGLDLRMHIV